MVMKPSKTLFSLITILVLALSVVPLLITPIIDSIQAHTILPSIGFSVIFSLPVLASELCAAFSLRYLLRPADGRGRARSILCTVLVSLGVICAASLLLFYYVRLELLLGVSLLTILGIGGCSIPALILRP